MEKKSDNIRPIINTIYNMDCIEGLKRIEDESVDMIITDPPYGIGIIKDNFMIGDNSNVMPLILNDLYRVLKPEGSIYIFLANKMLPDWILRLSMFFKRQNLIVWDKEAPTFQYGGANWGFSYEMIFFGIKSNKHKVRSNPRDVVRVKNIMRGRCHPTEKPAELIKRFLKVSSDEGNIVLDPFIGSGTTAVACIETRRNFIGFEINPEYCKIAEERLKKVPRRLDKFV